MSVLNIAKNEVSKVTAYHEEKSSGEETINRETNCEVL
jgi:hypothetical protein